jgi:hypothetical protein
MADVYGVEMSAVGYYGLTITSAMKASLKRLTIEWFADYGHAPNEEGAAGKGFSKLKKPSPTIQRKLDRVGYDNLTAFECNYTPPTGVGLKYPWMESYFDAARNGVVSFTCKSEIARVPSEGLFRRMRDIAQVIRSAYGIGFRRDVKQYADSYIHGFCAGQDSRIPEEAEEELVISRWGDIGMNEEQVYMKGELRDVYPWNFLTAPQLTAPVGRQTLEQWIRANPGFGTLIPVTDEMLLWETNEERIPEARKILWDAGRIFDYRKYLGPPGPPLTAEETLKRVLEAFGGDPEEFQILDGTGQEIPPDEIRKRIGKGKSKKPNKP